MNKDAYYFPHFSNARNDRKIKRLRKELGLEGYGIYFMILEILRDQEGFKYPIDDIDLLSDEFGTSEQKVRIVICNYTLFEIDTNNFFFSTKFNEFMQPYLNMKKQRRLAGKKSAEVRRKNKEISTTVERPLNGSSNNRITVAEQSKVNESKVNESKVKKINNKRDRELLDFMEMDKPRRVFDQIMFECPNFAKIEKPFLYEHFCQKCLVAKDQVGQQEAINEVSLIIRQIENYILRSQKEYKIALSVFNTFTQKRWKK